jgi:sulfonate transport system permease protein
MPRPAARRISPGPADTAPARVAGSAARRRNRTWFRIISPLVVLAGRQLVSMSGLISQQKLPPPSTVLHTSITLITSSNAAYGTLQGAMLVSLERVAIGFAVGGAAGLVLGVVAGLSRLGENSVDPLMQMLRTLPLFGLIPVFIVWFGIGQLPKILLIALGAAIPLYLNTFSGIRNVDAKLAEAGQSLGLRRSETIRHIILPGALPQILVGLRQAWHRLAGAGGRRADQRQRPARLHHQPGPGLPEQQRDLRGAARVLRPGPAHRRPGPADGKEGAGMAPRTADH